MGWDAVVFGGLRVGNDFNLAVVRRDALDRIVDDEWPFDGAVRDASVGDALDRWQELSGAEYGGAWRDDAGLHLAGYWSSGTLIDQGGTLHSVLRAFGQRGARGKVHVVGFGEDHVFTFTLSGKGATRAKLGDAAHRRLVTQAVPFLRRPAALGSPSASTDVGTRGATAAPRATAVEAVVPKTIEALIAALATKGAPRGGRHVSPEREAAGAALSASADPRVDERILALLTRDVTAIAKRPSMKTLGVPELEEQVGYLVEVLSILRRRRTAEARSQVWKLCTATHRVVATEAQRTLLHLLDDAEVKRIFGVTRAKFVATHTFLGVVPDLRVRELFERARGSLEKAK